MDEEERRRERTADSVDHEGWWCWWSLSWNETGDSEVVREGSC
jgi:hypothetical protein